MMKWCQFLTGEADGAHVHTHTHTHTVGRAEQTHTHGVKGQVNRPMVTPLLTWGGGIRADIHGFLCISLIYTMKKSKFYIKRSQQERK